MNTRKTRKCLTCRDRYPMDGMIKLNVGWFCNIEHAQQYGSFKSKANKEKADKKAHNEDKKNLRESNKKWMMNKTKELCHKFIRLRDHAEPCISCGLYEGEIDSSCWDHIWDAGHFLSRGSHPELRFEVLNIHKQCVKCNTDPNLSGQSRTVKEVYRESLIRKIGLDKVEWLEGPHPIPKRTLEDLKELQEGFKTEIKSLEKGLC